MRQFIHITAERKNRGFCVIRTIYAHSYFHFIFICLLLNGSFIIIERNLERK